MYEVSILIRYIICVDIFINKTVIRVNAMKSDVLKIDTKNNYVQLSQKKSVAKGLTHYSSSRVPPQCEHSVHSHVSA